ncbi:MAG: RHS repeat-associated core domain-containing protein [Candidatus Hydrogenedentes bacterium]|nr:RHS repeat-associated core domain-containing protein [Candidatus Hydrogenedentota bacterium]
MILRATPYPLDGPYTGHWKFLALVIQPDGIYLREWDKDEVTELGGAAVAIPKEQWHAVTIELSGADGETVTVKQALHNVSETQSIEATTTITEGEYIGFGVGEKANFRFDDVGTDKPVAGGIALRYHYDAYGRVVGRTLDPGGANVSQYFIYDNDRIVQELNTSGALVAEWVYGTYVDEILAMFRDTDGQPGLETYYYLQDDLYNVLGLTDANGNVVERYTYDDYGAPTVWIEDSQNPGTWIENAPNGVPVSDFGNPFMFTGRRWDEVLSLYDYRTRYYNPYLGRFLRIDTIGLWGDASNLGNPYAYVGNNPWSRLDPWGEQAGHLYLNKSPELKDIYLDGYEGSAEELHRVNTYNSAIAGTSGAVRAATSLTTDDAHAVLDALGLVPVVGLIFDTTNSAWYYVEGDPVNGTISAVSAIPAIGEASGIAKALGVSAGAYAVYKTWVRGTEYYYIIKNTDVAAAEAKRVVPKHRLPASANTFDKAGDAARIAPQGGVKRWKPGDDVYTPTKYGAPSDSTIRRRSWRNEALNPTRADYKPEDFERMRSGLPPQRYNPDKPGTESMELSHEPIPTREGGIQTVPRWPQEHAEVDSYRRPGY